MNAVSTADKKRTEAEVRKKWFDLKTSSKKNICTWKDEIQKTGGGQNKATPPAEIHYKVVDILGRESVEGVAGGFDTSNTSTPIISPVIPSAGNGKSF